MKVVLAVLVVALAAQAAYGDVLTDKWNEIKDEYTTRFSNMKDQLKDLGTAMKNVAIDKAKGLLSQTIQALIGAVANTVKGTSLGNVIGKREMMGFDAYLKWLVENTKEELGDLFNRTYNKFNSLIDRIVNGEQTDAEETKAELQQTAEAHNMAVRGVIGDTLNKGIDMVKSVWQKLKDAVGKPIPVHPITISKRGVLDFLKDQAGKLWDYTKKHPQDLVSKRGVLDWFKAALEKHRLTKSGLSVIAAGKRSFFSNIAQSLQEKFNQIHEAVKPHWEKIHLITTDIASALGHHAGKMMEATKQDALEKMKDMAGSLSEHLQKAKTHLGQMKEEVSAKIQEVLSG